jgi:hypothetical protein
LEKGPDNHHIHIRRHCPLKPAMHTPGINAGASLSLEMGPDNTYDDARHTCRLVHTDIRADIRADVRADIRAVARTATEPGWRRG